MRRVRRKSATSGTRSGSTHARPVGREVGRRIAALRKDKRLTLEALAAGTGLNVSFLSKLERGQTSISVDNLREVAHFLGVEMIHFFSGPEKSSAVVTRRGKGTPLQIANTDAVGEALIATMSGSLQATLYTTPQGQGRAKGFSHGGEELVYVIKGRLRFSNIAYLQPRFDVPSDLRILDQATFLVALTRSLFLSTTFEFRYDSDPPDELQLYDYSFQNGLIWRF